MIIKHKNPSVRHRRHFLASFHSHNSSHAMPQPMSGAQREEYFRQLCPDAFQDVPPGKRKELPLALRCLLAGYFLGSTKSGRQVAGDSSIPATTMSGVIAEIKDGTLLTPTVRTGRPPKTNPRMMRRVIREILKNRRSSSQQLMDRRINF